MYDVWIVNFVALVNVFLFAPILFSDIQLNI